MSSSDTHNYEIKVSVILPVYNVEACITRCIESLQAQTLRELEFIFVDDCSTDGSMVIVEAWAAEDKRVRILHNEENIGSGPSRNRGIEVARGEYLSFIDPDDYISLDFYELLYAVAAADGGYDIVKGSRMCVKENGAVGASPTDLNRAIGNGLAKGKPLYLLFTYQHYAAIYKRALFEPDYVRYGTSARAQDCTFLLRICSHASSFRVVDNARYYLCERHSSAMHGVSWKYLEGMLQATHEQITHVQKYLINDPYSQAYLLNVFLGGIRWYLYFESQINNKEILCRYREGLRSELVRLSQVEVLIKKSFPLRVLYDWAECLPANPFYMPCEPRNSSTGHTELLKRWLDFCLIHDEYEKEYIDELTRVVCRTRQAVKRDSPYNHTGLARTEGRMLFAKQMRRIPWRLRILMVLGRIN